MIKVFVVVLLSALGAGAFYWSQSKPSAIPIVMSDEQKLPLENQPIENDQQNDQQNVQVTSENKQPEVLNTETYIFKSEKPTINDNDDDIFNEIVSTPAKTYEIPPSTTTGINVPRILDVEMEKCVTIHNEAKWLADEFDGMDVDRYDEDSVNSYNSKVTKHKDMISYFNDNCAGKQSESAYKAAQKLNTTFPISQ